MTYVFWILALGGAGLLAAAAGVSIVLYRRLTGAHVRRRPFAEHCAALEPHIRTLYPDGEGLFPAVLLFHGCGGVRQVTHAYAERAVKAGVAAVIVDSLALRGIGYEQAIAQVCSGRRLWGRERAADVYAALELVRSNPKIDAGRLALAGWSHGAWTVLDALTLAAADQAPDGLANTPAAPFEGVRAGMMIYPYMSRPALAQRQNWLESVPIEAVLVENDTMANERDAQAALSRMKDRGAQVSWSMVSHVTHGFDEPDHHPDSPLRFDPQATEATQARFVDFLQRALAPAERERSSS